MNRKTVPIILLNDVTTDEERTKVFGVLGFIFLFESRRVIDDELPHPEIHEEAKIRDQWVA